MGPSEQRSSSPVVRLASEADLPAMLALWRTLEDAQGPHRVVPMVPDAEERVTWILREAMEAPDRRAFVVEDAAGLIAMAIASYEQPDAHSLSAIHGVELSRVVVRPDARKAGIGRALLDAANAFARECGATHVLAKVFAANADARVFWERAGFVERVVTFVRPVEGA